MELVIPPQSRKILLSELFIFQNTLFWIHVIHDVNNFIIYSHQHHLNQCPINLMCRLWNSFYILHFSIATLTGIIKLEHVSGSIMPCMADITSIQTKPPQIKISAGLLFPMYAQEFYDFMALNNCNKYSVVEVVLKTGQYAIFLFLFLWKHVPLQ